jgi:hypothetical protein
MAMIESGYKNRQGGSMRRWVGLVIILLIACFSYAVYADDLWDHRHGETRDVRATRLIEGRWYINANNHTGTLEISWSGDRYRGRVYFDDYQRWETLTNIQFDDLSRTKVLIVLRRSSIMQAA